MVGYHNIWPVHHFHWQPTGISQSVIQMDKQGNVCNSTCTTQNASRYKSNQFAAFDQVNNYLTQGIDEAHHLASIYHTEQDTRHAEWEVSDHGVKLFNNTCHGHRHTAKTNWPYIISKHNLHNNSHKVHTYFQNCTLIISCYTITHTTSQLPSPPPPPSLPFSILCAVSLLG